jgi:glycerophosphoryl diester phosphodiesterase
MIELAERSFDEVIKMGMEDQVVFSSFDLFPLRAIQERNPKIQVNFLYNKPWNSLKEVMGGDPFSILTFRKSVLTQAHISKAHQEGIKINVYTLNTEAEIAQFLEWGVDGIITDYPDRLIRILQTRNR